MRWSTWPKTFAQTPGLEITLLHILSGLPPAFWDDGHILDDQERESRQRLVASWQSRPGKTMARAGDSRPRIVCKGAGLTTVHSKFIPGHFDVAEDIVTEAVAMGAKTIVMGRRGLGTAQSLILGSITNKVIQNPQGRAVIVVE